jgi:hypothetical protein
MRDYFEHAYPIISQTKELLQVNEIKSFMEILRSYLIFLEFAIVSRISYLFSFQWRKDIIYFPIIAPGAQIYRSYSRIFSTAPNYIIDSFPINLDIVSHKQILIPPLTFQIGFLNSFFLSCPTSLVFLVNIRRCWLQGIKYGFLGMLGYRIGETRLLIRIVNGFRPFWYLNQSRIPIGFGIIITAYFLWECFNYRESVYYGKPFFQFRKKEYNRNPWTNDIYRVFLVFFFHVTYAWCEKGMLFSVFGGQILDTFGFSSVLSYFSVDQKNLSCLCNRSFLGGIVF